MMHFYSTRLDFLNAFFPFFLRYMLMFQVLKQSPSKVNMTRLRYMRLVNDNRFTSMRCSKLMQQYRSLFIPINSPCNKSAIKRSKANSSQAKDIFKKIEKKQALDKQNATADATTKQFAIKKTLWQKIKDEAIHYWHGTKLLSLEVRISSRLIYKMLRGSKLTRRENRQVKRKKTNQIFNHSKKNSLPFINSFVAQLQISFA